MSAIDPVDAASARLEAVLASFPTLAVAASGGVDSTTLAWIAHGVLGRRATMVHALSAAVPEEATARVRAHADRAGWDLRLIAAGETEDPRYRANPVDRCFFCKTNLYRAIRGITAGPIASGTNLDDLGDFRPGLRAAAEAGVRHPFVEARIDKAGVRALARARGLVDLAELPASPCLASRLETGIEVTGARLGLVAAVERRLAELLGAGDQRCRILASGIEIQLDPARLQRLSADARRYILAEVGRVLRTSGIDRPVALGPYRRGSAFLRRSGG